MSEEKTGIARRGFASMTPERRREIASKGGSSVDPANRSFSKSRELASKAGAKGGSAVPASERAYTKDPELARKAGRKGGSASVLKRTK